MGITPSTNKYTTKELNQLREAFRTHIEKYLGGDLSPEAAIDLYHDFLPIRAHRAFAYMWMLEQYDALDRNRVLSIERQAERRAKVDGPPPEPLPDPMPAYEQPYQRESPRAYKARLLRIAYGEEEPQSEEEREEATRERRYRDELAEIDMRHHEKMAQLLSDFATELKISWTTELLEAEFALGDGTSVKWGEATPQQHEQRMDLLRANISGNLDTLKRHEAALQLLVKTNTHSLKEAVAWQTT